MIDTKITAEEAKALIVCLVEDAVYVDHGDTLDQLIAYISQSEREIAELRAAHGVGAEEYITVKAANARLMQERDDAFRQLRESRSLGRVEYCDGCEHAEKERDAAVERAEKAEATLAEYENCGPEWTCADCGQSQSFRPITYDTPGEPLEYDMECVVCESRDVRESATEAADALGDKLDEERATREKAEAAAAEMRAALMDLVSHADNVIEEHGHKGAVLRKHAPPCNTLDFCVMRDYRRRVIAAQSVLDSIAGTGWHSPEEWTELTRKREEAREAAGTEKLELLARAYGSSSACYILRKERDEERRRWESMRERYRDFIDDVETAVSRAWDRMSEPKP